MKKAQGYPLPLGVNAMEGKMNFSAAVPEEASCRLLLYRVGETTPAEIFDMPEVAGEVHFLALEGLLAKEYEYNFEIAGTVTVDPYVKALSGRNEFGGSKQEKAQEVRGCFIQPGYDWEGDRPLQIPYQDIVAYSLHVRGFTKHTSSKVKHKGTFCGVSEKLDYLTELGINQIQCMPVYDFWENKAYTNYWGYGPSYYFAPKGAYSATGDAVTELKDMVKACHRAGIEVVLNLPFVKGVQPFMVGECLRYYVMEYHVDGFILDPETAPIQALRGDPFLKKVKIMKKQDGFQNTMRRFLKGDEGMVEGVIWWMRRHSKEDCSFNYITDQSGFTMNDLVSYDGKHNEANGENNLDGADYNYSWNCGAEGKSRKKTILSLRDKQMRNAFFLLLMAQGTPCILAGDEFANTQNGNNNVYCQDNETGWLNFKKLEQENCLWLYVKDLISFRKAHPIFHPKVELQGIDQTCCGIPDISYHGENAWQVPSEVASRQLGIYYSGERGTEESYFIAYNMHWLKHTFALPALKNGKKWYQILSTKNGEFTQDELVKEQRAVEIEERTIVMFVGR